MGLFGPSIEELVRSAKRYNEEEGPAYDAMKRIKAKASNEAAWLQGLQDIALMPAGRSADKDFFAQAAELLARSDEPVRIRAYLRLVEEASRRNLNNENVFRAARWSPLERLAPAEAAPAIGRAIASLVPVAWTADDRVASLVMALKGMSSPAAAKLQANLDTVLAKHISDALALALSSDSRDTVQEVIKNLLDIDTPAARTALSKIKGMPSRQLNYTKYVDNNLDDGTGDFEDRSVDSSGLGNSLYGDSRERWAAIKPA